MSTVSKHFITSEEYLHRERQAEFRSEYFRGEVFAMAGASANHNLIVGNCVQTFDCPRSTFHRLLLAYFRWQLDFD